MEAFQTLVDYLAAPPRLFTLALVLFLASRSSRVPFSRAGGLVLFGLTAALAGAGLSDQGCRRLLLHPERLPVVILVLSSAAVLWLEMRRFHHGDGDGADTRRPVGHGGLTSTDALAAPATGVALAACVLLQPPALGPEADPVSRPDLVKAPWFFAGLQELEHYFDPWVPYLALPLLLVAGLFALPYLQHRPAGEPAGAIAAGDGGRRRSLFLFGWLLLWLWPMTVAALLRGPRWIAFGPFQGGQATHSPLPAPQPLSEIFWLGWLRGFEPSSWWLRELPGMLLVAAYFGLLPLALRRFKVTRTAFASYRKTMGIWPFRAAVAWVLAVMTVPLKMYGQWLWNVGYWIHLPELSFNF